MTVALQTEPASSPVHEPIETCEDAELVRRARDGDKAAFEQLVRRHRRGLTRSIASIVDGADRDDVSQRAWIKIYRKLHTLRKPAYFFAWAKRITINTALALLRKRGRRNETDLEALPRSKMPVDDRAGAEERIRWRDMLEKTDRWFQQLDAEDRKLFRHAIVDGMTMAEISEVVDLSKGGVKTRLFRARQYLRGRRKKVS